MSDIDINGDEVMDMDGYCDLFFIEVKVNRRFQVKSEDDQKKQTNEKNAKNKISESYVT